jgi:hypothetical protein
VSSALGLGALFLDAGCWADWRCCCWEGRADDAEGLAVAEGLGLDWAEAVGLGDVTGGPELTSRFTAVSGFTCDPAGYPCAMTLPSATSLRGK